MKIILFSEVNKILPDVDYPRNSNENKKKVAKFSVIKKIVLIILSNILSHANYAIILSQKYTFTTLNLKNCYIKAYR